MVQDSSIALVTGANRGLDLALAQGLLAAGVRNGIRLEVTNYRQDRRERHDNWDQLSV